MNSEPLQKQSCGFPTVSPRKLPDAFSSKKQLLCVCVCFTACRLSVRSDCLTDNPSRRRDYSEGRTEHSSSWEIKEGQRPGSSFKIRFNLWQDSQSSGIWSTFSSDYKSCEHSHDFPSSVKVSKKRNRQNGAAPDFTAPAGVIRQQTDPSRISDPKFTFDPSGHVEGAPTVWS